MAILCTGVNKTHAGPGLGREFWWACRARSSRAQIWGLCSTQSSELPLTSALGRWWRPRGSQPQPRMQLEDRPIDWGGRKKWKRRSERGVKVKWKRRNGRSGKELVDCRDFLWIMPEKGHSVLSQEVRVGPNPNLKALKNRHMYLTEWGEVTWKRLL